MTILAHSVLSQRLAEIFKAGTYTPQQVKEASYDLRLAADGLFFGGRWYTVGCPPLRDIKIGAGELAVLSSQEEFTMPTTLVGIVNVKFKSALRGVMLVFGSRVDPGYGRDVRQAPEDPYTGQRLYLLICNISDHDLYVRSGDSLFMVEFHTLEGDVELYERQNNDHYVGTQIGEVGRFGFLAGVGARVSLLEKTMTRLEGMEQRVHYVVVFGFVLLAVTLLGVAAGFVMSFTGARQTVGPPAAAPSPQLTHTDAPRAMAEGYVAAVAGDVVRVRATRVEGLQTGDHATLVRMKSVTGSAAEEYIGRAQLIEKDGGLFAVRLLGAHTPLRVGDVVKAARIDDARRQD